MSGPATERGEETRATILELAARDIAEKGVGGWSLNDLIRQSGLTKGAFYFHFRSKDDLVREVYRYQQEKWVARVMQVVATKPRALDRLLAMPRALVEVHRTDPAARAFERMCTDLSGDPAFRVDMRAAMDGWEDTVAQTLREAQAEGDVRDDVDVEAVARISVAGFIGMEELSYALTDGEDLGDRVEEFLDLLVRAIATGST